MSNPHDVNTEDLVATDMTKFIPPCPVCGGRDWYVESSQRTETTRHAWGHPTNIMAVGPVAFTAQCRTCGATGSGENPMDARNNMTNETTMTDHEIQIIREAIVALIRHREFLGYQLCHANGGMDDDQLEEIAKKYLAERHYPDDDLHDRLVVLKQLVGELDPEVAATMLQCPIEQVLNAWPTELE